MGCNGLAVAAQQPVAEPPFRNPELPIEQRVGDLISRLTIEEKIGRR